MEVGVCVAAVEVDQFDSVSDYAVFLVSQALHVLVAILVAGVEVVVVVVVGDDHVVHAVVASEVLVEEVEGAGVSAVVGGGDTACEEAMYLSSLAKKVYMIVRKPYLRAAEIMRKRVEEKENIEILYNTNTLGLFGENGVEGAHLVRFKGEENEEKYDIQIDGFFLAIGHKPNTDLFKGQLELDAQGFIVTQGVSTATSKEGVFAAGDVADPIYRQGVVAAGSGAKAAIEAERFLQDKGEK